MSGDRVLRPPLFVCTLTEMTVPRDWDLIRALLLLIARADVDLSPWTAEQVAYHVALIGPELGGPFVDGEMRLTVAGSRFVSLFTDGRTWRMVRRLQWENDLPAVLTVFEMLAAG
jgi:hypothetical protein